MLRLTFRLLTRRPLRFFSIDNYHENVLIKFNLELKTTPTQIRIKDCFFCPKPNNGKLDNLFTLNVAKQSGLFYCHRCNAKGNFKQIIERLDPNSPVNSHKDQSLQFKPSNVRADEAQHFSRVKALWSESGKQVLDYLLNERKLKAQTLQLYRVGTCVSKFLNEFGEYQSVHCVAFPTYRPNSIGQKKRFLKNLNDFLQINKDPSAQQNFFNAMVNSPDYSLAKIKLRGAGKQLKSFMKQQPAGALTGLFGFNTVKQSDKAICITQGQYDAMAVYQATGIPSISVPTGAGSFPVHSIPWLKRFQTIYLWMDNDQAGTLNSPKIATKLGVQRTHIVQLKQGQGKDANDLVKQGKEAQVLECIVSSRTIPSKNILNFQNLKQKTKSKIFNYHKHIGVQSTSIKFFNKKVKGLRQGQLSILSGGTGSGKTTLLSQLSLDFCKQGVKTLWGSFEISNQNLLITMLKQFSGVNIMNHKQKFDYFSQKFESLPLYFLSFYGSTPAQEVIDTISYAVQKHQIQHVVIDTLQFMLSNQAQGFRKFELQDQTVAMLRQLATKNKIHVSIVIHPRKFDEKEDLGIHTIFGTAKVTQQADNVWLIQQREGFKVFQVKKNRFDGEVGRVALGFNRESKSYFELTRKEFDFLLKKEKTVQEILRDRKSEREQELDMQSLTGSEQLPDQMMDRMQLRFFETLKRAKLLKEVKKQKQ